MAVLPRNCWNLDWTSRAEFHRCSRGEGKDGEFLVIVNNYSENTTFEAVKGVLNRGYLNGVQVTGWLNQSDQIFGGVSYHQSVWDNDMGAGIHEEMGFFFHQSCMPTNGHLTDDWQVFRMGSIPHGSMPMGFGPLMPIVTPDENYYVQMLIRLKDSLNFSVMPFVPGCGSKFIQQSDPKSAKGPLTDLGCCVGNRYMLGPNGCPDTGCPEPIDQLIQAAKDWNVVNYTELDLTTENITDPVPPEGTFESGIKGGGVMNTAFVNIMATAEPKSFRNKVWLVTIQNTDGSISRAIQYIETVDIKFLANAFGCPSILWPHVDANTLYKDTPPSPSPKKTGGCLKGPPGATIFECTSGLAYCIGKCDNHGKCKVVADRHQENECDLHGYLLFIGCQVSYESAVRSLQDIDRHIHHPVHRDSHPKGGALFKDVLAR